MTDKQKTKQNINTDTNAQKPSQILKNICEKEKQTNEERNEDARAVYRGDITG